MRTIQFRYADRLVHILTSNVNLFSNRLEREQCELEIIRTGLKLDEPRQILLTLLLTT